MPQNFSGLVYFKNRCIGLGIRACCLKLQGKIELRLNTLSLAAGRYIPFWRILFRKPKAEGQRELIAYNSFLCLKIAMIEPSR